MITIRTQNRIFNGITNFKRKVSFSTKSPFRFFIFVSFLFNDQSSNYVKVIKYLFLLPSATQKQGKKMMKICIRSENILVFWDLLFRKKKTIWREKRFFPVISGKNSRLLCRYDGYRLCSVQLFIMHYLKRWNRKIKYSPTLPRTQTDHCSMGNSLIHHLFNHLTDENVNDILFILVLNLNKKHHEFSISFPFNLFFIFLSLDRSIRIKLLSTSAACAIAQW